MGETRRRAEARRKARAEQKPEPKYADTVGMFTEVRWLLPRALYTQIRARHQFVKKQFESETAFIAALLETGVEGFDQDMGAFQRHAAGEAKPVDPKPEPERAVLLANEVPIEQTKVLAQLHDANVAYAGRRTARGR